MGLARPWKGLAIAMARGIYQARRGGAGLQARGQCPKQSNDSIIWCIPCGFASPKNQTQGGFAAIFAPETASQRQRFRPSNVTGRSVTICGGLLWSMLTFELRQTRGQLAGPTTRAFFFFGGEGRTVPPGLSWQTNPPPVRFIPAFCCTTSTPLTLSRWCHIMMRSCTKQPRALRHRPVARSKLFVHTAPQC